MKFTSQEDDFIRQNYLKIPTKRISTLLGRNESSARQRMIRLGLVIPREIIEKFKAESYIKKGSVSFNKGKKQADYMTAEAIARTAKTRFNKGNQPHNTKFDGAERITRDGYVEIRLAKRVWKLKHRVEWEKVNPPIGDDILTCKTDDKTNCNPDNWQLITRAQHAVNNSSHDNPTDNRVASYLATTSRRHDPELKQVILGNPELIEAKRTQLLLNKKIKNHGTEQNSRS